MLALTALAVLSALRTAFCAPQDYAGIGSYAVRSTFGGDPEKIRQMLARVKAEGIRYIETKQNRAAVCRAWQLAEER